MQRYEFIQPHQLEPVARFLEEHPGFSPILIGEDALVRGFQIGGTYITIQELERIIANRRPVEVQRAAALLAPATGLHGER